MGYRVSFITIDVVTAIILPVMVLILCVTARFKGEIRSNPQSIGKLFHLISVHLSYYGQSSLCEYINNNFLKNKLLTHKN